jgi:hypothetical protein
MGDWRLFRHGGSPGHETHHVNLEDEKARYLPPDIEGIVRGKACGVRSKE